jgi:alpha-ketoglutarate-dependent taurine dioxygenase
MSALLSPERKVTVSRLPGPLGAEILGLDLANQPFDATVPVVRDAIEKYHFVCVRSQDLTVEQQIAFTENFGPLEVQAEAYQTKDKPVIFNAANVAADGGSLPVDDPRVIAQKINARFHTDSSWRYVPAHLSFLHATEALPPEAEGGETEFSDMFLAYEALSDEMKATIEPLHMVHGLINGRRLNPGMTPLAQDVLENFPPACHPLVRVHPQRGSRRSLFFSANVANEVGGLTLEEGQRLHRLLAQHVERPEFCHLHKWQRGDLMIWDNTCVLHRAKAYDMARYRRVAQRTTVAGSGPVIGPYSRLAP